MLVARHGFDEAPDHPGGKWEMSKNGKNQVNQLSKLISKFKPDYVIHSGLPRSQQTAEMLKVSKKTKLIMNGLFAEQKAGTSFEEVSDDGFIEPDNRLGGGESYREMFERVKTAWNWITSTFDIGRDERIVIIGHRRFMAFFISYVMGLSPNGFNMNIKHTSYIIFSVTNGWRPQLILPMPDEEYL